VTQIHIQVRVADRGGGRAHDHFPRTGNGNGAIDQNKISGLLQNGCFHRMHTRVFPPRKPNERIYVPNLG
jgi:hypothetical protein